MKNATTNQGIFLMADESTPRLPSEAYCRRSIALKCRTHSYVSPEGRNRTMPSRPSDVVLTHSYGCRRRRQPCSQAVAEELGWVETRTLAAR